MADSSNGGIGGRVPLHKMFALADRKDVALMAIGSAAAVVRGVSAPLMALLFGDVVDAFGDSSDSSLVYVAASKNFDIIVEDVTYITQENVSCWTLTGERQVAQIRTLYLKTILRQDMAFFDTHQSASAGECVARISGDTTLIQEAIVEKVGRFIQLVSTFLTGLVLALSRGWLLTVVVMASIFPLMFIALSVLSRSMSVLSARAQAANAEAASVAEQTIGDIRTVVSFGGERRAVDKYNHAIEACCKSELYMDAVVGGGSGLFQLVLFSTCGLAIWFGSTLIIKKGYSAGTVVSVMTIIMNATPSIEAARVVTYRMFETIQRKPQIDADAESGLVLGKLRGDVDLRNVYFCYPARSEQMVLEDFSLRLPAGTTTALVGESGSGKSTVVSLLQRFYDPDSGQIMLDGVDLKQLKLSWVRMQIGLVSQEPALFTSTIRENLAYGKRDATENEMWKVLELVNADTFIYQLPKGLDTIVGEHAKDLSGGQKQRIAIARSILKDPKILILDEATSALDVESEKSIQVTLEKIMWERTSLIVSHRLSTIRNADAIVVVHRGKLVEHGSHAKLSKDRNGAYSHLIRLQENVQRKDVHDSIVTRQPQTSDMDRSLTPPCSSSILSLDGDDSMIGLASPLLDDDKRRAEAAVLKTSPKEESLRTLICFRKVDVPVVLFGCLAAALRGVLLPALGMLIASSISTLQHQPPSELGRHAAFYAQMFVALGTASLIVSLVKHYIFGLAGARVVQRVRSISFDRVVHNEIGWFDEPSHTSGAIGARLTGDAMSIKRVFGDVLEVLAEDMATVVAGLAIGMVANWKLASIFSSIIPCMVLESYAQMKFLTESVRSGKERYEEAGSMANDAISNVRTLASLCMQSTMAESYKNKCHALKALAVRQGITSAAAYGLASILVNCFHGACFFVGAMFVQQGAATTDEVFTGTTLQPHAVRGEVELRNVSFRYPMRRHLQVLRGMYLTIPPGKTLGLVGQSGSGKSTIIALLERFYDPDHGVITLDGMDLRMLKVSWLRQQMGLVAQEPVLHNGSIWENIVYGAQAGMSYSWEEVVAAADAAGAHGFISSLPSGYDTRVGPRGVRLSGGQKQRVAIARVVLRDPRIVLLDEATSALDTESECAVMRGVLGRLANKRTCVIVAHRLATVAAVDKIAVVRDGIIAEQGRLEDLLRLTGGLYTSLVNSTT
uniref:MDR-like ABC transporter n=1 Tax=Oryza punctata TaxID=4537 RepID=A0A0E0KMH3_ORYPU